MRVECRKHVGNKQRKLCGNTVGSTCIGQCRLIAEHCGLRLAVIRAVSNVSFSQNIQHYNFSSAAVFCGCVTCSVQLREENMHWVIESRSEEEEIAGGWRRLRCKQSPHLCSSPNIIRAMKFMSINPLAPELFFFLNFSTPCI